MADVFFESCGAVFSDKSPAKSYGAVYTYMLQHKSDIS